MINILFDNENDWLGPMHFLYALLDEYPFKSSLEDYEVKHNIRVLNDFYKNRLYLLIQQGRISKGCIRSPQHLSYHLGVLHNLEVVERRGNRKKTKYKINKDFNRKLFRVENHTALDLFPNNQINNYASKGNKDENIRHIIYGFTESDYNRIEKDEKQAIQNCLRDIEENIQIIEKIKSKNDDKKLDKIKNDLFKKTDSQAIKRLITERYGGLLGIIYGLININYTHRHTIPQETIEHNIEYQLSSFPWFKEFNLSKDDIAEICNWAKVNHRKFCSTSPLTIAFSRYREYEQNPLR